MAVADCRSDGRDGTASVNLFRFLRKKKPCYRCGGDATVQYMGLDYCRICQTVIVRMLPMIGLGGMFGFPGSSGYLEFPELEKKEG